MAPADYARLLPPLESLVKDYGMDPVRSAHMVPLCLS